MRSRELAMSVNLLSRGWNPASFSIAGRLRAFWSFTQAMAFSPVTSSSQR